MSSKTTNMKKNNLIFWISTGLVSLMMVFSAYSYLTNESIKAAFTHLGFPSYFRVELAIAKIIGAVILLLPVIPDRIKQFAYAGFGIVFISAAVAHSSSGDPVNIVVMPLIFLLVLSVSWIFNEKRLKTA